MTPTRQLHDLGQSLWLDNITRELLDNGTLRRYIEEFSVTGLTSNPTIFDEAIGGGAYDAGIRQKAQAGKSGEALFMELALEDLRRALEAAVDIRRHADFLRCAVNRFGGIAQRLADRQVERKRCRGKVPLMIDGKRRGAGFKRADCR